MTERSERSKRISAGMRLHWANRRTLALARLAGQAETMPAMEAALREIHGIATHSLCETWDEDANAMMRICSVVERALPVKQESDHA
jgi:hypothetical protein